MLLSRVADDLYWGARYTTRAEDTARIVRTYTEVIIDLPVSVSSSWEPLLALTGSRAAEPGRSRTDEASIVRYLVADQANAGSIVSVVAKARENLRTTREILPREAWQSINDLYLYTAGNGESGVDRRSRARFLTRIVTDIQQIEGIIAGSMSRDQAHDLWRLGQSIERADMTTRVVGVRAALLMERADPGARRATGREGSAEAVDAFEHVQWMGVLRSLGALQMYQRATPGPIEGASVVDFLLHDVRFPRSVASCVRRARSALARLPQSERLLPCVDHVEATIGTSAAAAEDGDALDRSMDRVQVSLAQLSDAVVDAFVRRPR